MKYIILLPFLFLACSKQTQQPVRVGGAMPDMPNTVQIVTSPSFNKESVAIKGRPVKASPVFYSPVNGAVVSGVVNISISTGSIYINGVLVGGTSYSWNTNGLFSGYYTITAIAKGVSTSIIVSINTIVVEPPPQPVSGVQINMPPALDQGSEGSCVAFAVGYAARSVEYFNATQDLKTFSPEHLYNPIKFSADCYSGTAMQTALEFIMANGILPWSSMPYTSGSCDLYANELQKVEALTYKIAGFFKMYTTDTAAIKGMVRLKKPVIINVIADQSFMDAKGYFLWDKYSGSGSLPHCIVICGYDDSKEAYQIFNSWGAEWGESGKAWISYDFFLTRTGTYCYSMK